MMSDYLPEEIVTEILVRLPLKAFVRFTAVCKSWRSLITSPKLAFARISISEHARKPLLVRRFDKELSREFYSLLELAGHDPSIVQSCTELNFPFECRIGYFRAVGSVHGLVCLSDDLFSEHSKSIILWNPMVRNHVMLPKALCKPDEPHYFVLGFGSAAGDYKVVRLVYCKRSFSLSVSVFWSVEIYSLNLGKWRVLSGASVSLRVPEFLWSQVFLNGSVHWLAYDTFDDGRMRSSILTFDLSKEVFNELTLPRELVNETVMMLLISAIGSSLAAVKYDVEGKSCDVWMMKDSHSSESWTKLYKIDFDFSVGIGKVIAFRDSGEALMVLGGHQMALYDPKSKQIKNIGIHGTVHAFYIEKYMESTLLFGRRNDVVEDEFKSLSLI